MPNSNWPNHPELFGMITAFIITIVSGTISIGRRILAGHPPSFLWIMTEYLTAMLCAYLTYVNYEHFQHLLPEGFTRILLVAIMAHSGGRFIQEIEKTFIERLKRLGKR